MKKNCMKVLKSVGFVMFGVPVISIYKLRNAIVRSYAKKEASQDLVSIMN